MNMPANIDTTKDSRSARPPHPSIGRPRSQPSPRKVKTITRLSKPIIRTDNNRNNTINEYGERKIDVSKIEHYYSNLIDELGESGQVHVPTHMRHKMIHAIIETEKPHLYHAMTHLHKHYMTSSEAREARMKRQKAIISKPPTLQESKPSYHQEMCYRDDIKAQKFTEKLIKVMLMLQNNEEHDYQLNLKSKEREKASLRGVHIKVVVASFFGSIVQKATRTIIRRERKIYHEKVMYDKRVADAQIIVANAWRRYSVYCEAKQKIQKILVVKAAKIEKERLEDESFLRKMNARMLKEQKDYAAWQTTNTHVTFPRTRTIHNTSSSLMEHTPSSLFLPPRRDCLIPKSPESRGVSPIRPGSRAKNSRSSAPDPHIEALMQKYGKPSIIDGYSRKTRFFDVQL